MSCMMLPAEHFAAIVGSVHAHSHGVITNTPSLMRQLLDHANELADANAKAWTQRYSHRPGKPRATVPAITSRMIEAFVITPLSVFDTNQAIRCYQYQASDWNEWEGSKAERLSLYMQRALLDAECSVSDVWVISELPASKLEQAMSERVT
jgi:hypothetical protein